jgi:hypothetical protein
VNARNVSGAISVTPILRIGQLNPQISVSTATGKRVATLTSGEAGARLPVDVIAKPRSLLRPHRQRFSVFALMQLARLRHPCVAADTSGKLREHRVEMIDVALGPMRDLAKR